MKRGASFFLATLRTIIYIFLSTIETIATTLIFLGLCCVNRSTFLPHFSTTPIHFHNSSTINRLFLQSYFTSSRINSGCGSCGHCFLPKLYTLFPATISSPVLNQAKQAPIKPAISLSRKPCICYSSWSTQAVHTEHRVTYQPRSSSCHLPHCHFEPNHFLAFMSCSLNYLPVWRFMSFLLAMQR